MSKLSCFKSYDVRGQLGVNLDEDIAYRIGRAFAEALNPETVVCGRDGRESSPALQSALIEGLTDGGVDVLDIGLCGTEEVYFGTDHFAAGGGIMVTASHNPIDYNGFKLVKEEARPLSFENGLDKIHDLAAQNTFSPRGSKGERKQLEPRGAYANRVLSFVDPTKISELKIVANAGNGVAGPTFDCIADRLAALGGNVDLVRINHEPDAAFPNGIPNPLLSENQPVTSQAVVQAGADFGIAWDGDFDRCFFFDETGRFIEGEYVVGLLAAAFVAKEPGARIVHDTRIQWNTQDLVAKAGGMAVPSRTGHPLMKQKMRDVDALYGGEMSAHHYFRAFMYCDSGMIPWLLVAEFLATSGRKLSELVADMRENFPSSGERNFRVENPDAAIRAFEDIFVPTAKNVDRLDGISVAFDDWRANLRQSNTEPLLRLNVETRGNHQNINTLVMRISEILEQSGVLG